MSPVLHITLIVLMMVLRVRAESQTVIVDDPVQFPVKCPMNETAELHREDGTGNPPLVAARRDGVCTPGGGFTDRLELNSCFAFRRSLYTDSGLYEFTCGSSTVHIQLDVVVASDLSVSEGEAVKLKCFYNTAGRQVEVLRWEKNGDMVLEKKLSTGEVRYGPGFEGVRLSPASGGDFSLMWDHVQLQDDGDYFCSVRSDGAKARGDPAAARLKVKKTHLDPTTTCPPTGTAGGRMDTWIIVVIVVITALVTSAFWALCLFLVRRLKLCTPSGQNVPHGPADGRPPTDEMRLLTNGNSAGPQTNGGPKVQNLTQ